MSTTDQTAMQTNSERREDEQSTPPATGPRIPPELVDGLMDKVQSEGLELLGEGGVLAELTKTILERALDEELTDHLGYERGDPGGRGSGNSRNGSYPKTVLTEIGAVDLDVPGTGRAASSPGSSRRARPVWTGSTPTLSPCTPGASPPGTSAESSSACTAWTCPQTW